MQQQDMRSCRKQRCLEHWDLKRKAKQWPPPRCDLSLNIMTCDSKRRVSGTATYTSPSKHQSLFLHPDTVGFGQFPYTAEERGQVVGCIHGLHRAQLLPSLSEQNTQHHSTEFFWNVHWLHSFKTAGCNSTFDRLRMKLESQRFYEDARSADLPHYVTLPASLDERSPQPLTNDLGPGGSGKLSSKKTNLRVLCVECCVSSPSDI